MCYHQTYPEAESGPILYSLLVHRHLWRQGWIRAGAIEARAGSPTLECRRETGEAVHMRGMRVEQGYGDRRGAEMFWGGLG